MLRRPNRDGVGGGVKFSGEKCYDCVKVQRY